MIKKLLATVLSVSMIFSMATPTVATTVKNQDDTSAHITVESMSVSNSTPTYTGSGSGRTGSTTVSMTFVLSNESRVVKTEPFTGINVSSKKEITYEIGCYNAAVEISVTASGTNNQMTITGTSAIIKNLLDNYAGEVTSPATCDAEGVMTFTCSLCEDSYTEPIAQLEHVYNEGEVTSPATCDAAGETTFTCSLCDGSYTEAIAQLEHVYDEGVYTDPVCGTDGYTTFTCGLCDSTNIVADEGSALQHNYVSEVTSPATCDAEGEMTLTCSNCGDSYTEPIAQLEHAYDNGVYTDPVCGTDGYTTFTCELCGSTNIVADEGTALLHNYVSEVTSPATCDTEGVTTFTCINCNDSYTEPIAQNPENHIDETYEEIITPATTEAEGLMGIYCSGCDALIGTRSIARLPSGNSITVNGVTITFQVISGVAVLRPTQEQMARIFSDVGNNIVFNLNAYSAVDIYIDAVCFKNIDKTLTFITDKGSCTVKAKELWNNSGKQRLISIRNNKVDFKNVDQVNSNNQGSNSQGNGNNQVNSNNQGSNSQGNGNNQGNGNQGSNSQGNGNNQGGNSKGNNGNQNKQ